MTADIDALLRATSHAFRSALHAVLEDDVPRARSVLKGSAARRRLVGVACEDLRSQPWVPVLQLNGQLLFVADIGRIGDLIDLLARHVVAHEDPVLLTPPRRAEVEVLLGAGESRLEQLLAAPSGQAMDPAYRISGTALFGVCDHAGHDPSAVLATCADLAAQLLQASRHATRAA